MTILDEGKQIRSEIAKLRPDKRRRYSEELRTRILNWVDRSRAAGMMEHECSKVIGVKTWRFSLWRRVVTDWPRARRAPPPPPKSESLALVQLETPLVEVAASTLAVIAPSGHRVEGLGLTQVVVLLRELA